MNVSLLVARLWTFDILLGRSRGRFWQVHRGFAIRKLESTLRKRERIWAGEGRARERGGGPKERGTNEEERERERAHAISVHRCGLQHTLPRHRGIALGDVTRAQRHRPIGGSR